MTEATTETEAPGGTDLPLVLCEVEVSSIERLSPSFVRVEFFGSELAEVGVDSGPFYDQRFKFIFPNAKGKLPSLEGVNESWFESWMEIPAEERGHMRTYTVRDLRGEGAETRLVVDFVLHGDGGAHGPAGDWAESASVGHRLVTLLPRRGVEFGGIEFAPGDARELLLVGDETAVPAIASIVKSLPGDARGHVFAEVPLDGDAYDLQGPEGVKVSWLPRNGCDQGHKLVPALRAHFGLSKSEDFVDPDSVDPGLWETPEYSSSGAEEAAPENSGRSSKVDEFDGLYAWIAGESRVVTTIRRALVKELGIDRRHVAFMGYWRQGVSMRS